MADRGFTLPVWLAAAAVAALAQLRHQPFDPRPLLQLRPDDPSASAEPVPTHIENAASPCQPCTMAPLTSTLVLAVPPRLWTDAYLAATAQAGGLRLVTLDRDFERFGLATARAAVNHCPITGRERCDL